METVSTTCYVQVEPEWGYAYGGTQRPLTAIKARKISQKKPDKPIPGSVTLKLRLNIPKAVFLPLEPAADVTFEMSDVVVNRGEVLAASEPADG